MIKSEKGQATVELALTLTILMLFIFLIIDFGRIFHTYLTLEHASREGARLASVGATDDEVVQRIRTNTISLNSNQLTITQAPNRVNRTRGTYVTVQLTYPITVSIPLIKSVLPDPIILHAETVMRVE
ncbi:TadE/TadG family type IV pilus assembly protein [Evansella tamaricis]|uniref:Pilus assembly protein n=1 Tax=Evansella tamaricis TaxID=2069301 RepID=A0ABS6JD40_9BACI|nr:TadE/TadG family type IV pilus assembly protein [Evansella tamaricis]MBU9711584.1 pilus assembly protein [Evansella tamaricis]